MGRSRVPSSKEGLSGSAIRFALASLSTTTVYASHASDASSATAEPSSCDDDQNYEEEKVEDLHDFVKHRELDFQDEDAGSNERAGNPWAEKWSEMSPEKKLLRSALLIGMRVSHPDKLVVR